ncbi:MAG: phage head closure protein [Alphaproteobacteria bacterium]|nr:phage head closure protein [Alphaproteobacteria bacterium]
MLQIGHLRERVTLQKRARIPDSLGGYTYTWAEAQTVWAYIEQIKDKALTQSKNNKCKKSMNKFYYKIRFRHGIKIFSDMRLKWGSLQLQVMGEPVSDPFKKWLDVTAYSIRS